MADDVVLGSKITDLNEPGESQLRACVEAEGLIIGDIRRDGPEGLSVTVYVPEAKSNDGAATKALQAVKTFVSGPGAGWKVIGYVGFGSYQGEV